MGDQMQENLNTVTTKNNPVDIDTDMSKEGEEYGDNGDTEDGKSKEEMTDQVKLRI